MRIIAMILLLSLGCAAQTAGKWFMEDSTGSLLRLQIDKKDTTIQIFDFMQRRINEFSIDQCFEWLQQANENIEHEREMLAEERARIDNEVKSLQDREKFINRYEKFLQNAQQIIEKDLGVKKK